MYISVRFTLILSSDLHLGFSRGLRTFFYVLHIKILKALLPSPIQTACPALPNLQDLIILTIFGERYKLRSSSLRSVLHSPFFNSLEPIYSLQNILCSSLNLRGHVSRPYNGTDNIISYVFFLKFQLYVLLRGLFFRLEVL